MPVCERKRLPPWGQIGDADQSTLDRLKTLLLSATTTDRSAALRAIMLLGGNEKLRESLLPFKDQIVRSLADDDASVRWMAIYALEFSGLPPTDVLPLLLRSRMDDSSAEVRRVGISGNPKLKQKKSIVRSRRPRS